MRTRHKFFHADFTHSGGLDFNGSLYCNTVIKPALCCVKPICFVQKLKYEITNLYSRSL